MKRLLIILALVLASCTTSPTRIMATQELGTPTNTPFALWTQFYVTVYRTPVPQGIFIPLGTLTFTPQPTNTVIVPTSTPVIIQINYVTIVDTYIYNNQGLPMVLWKSGTPFTTGDWVKNGRLYLGPGLPNRWITVGTYERK